MVERIQPIGPPNLLNNMVKVFVNTGNTLLPSNLRTPFGARHESSGVPKQGDKFGSGCLTPAFSGVQKRAEVLRNPYVLGGSPNKGTKSEVKTHARINNDAPSISKYGSLVRPNAQIVAVRAHCAKCAPLVHPLKGHRWGTGQKSCPAR